jgi:hypothetical protein
MLKSGEHLVRYRNAAILSAVLIGGMFGLPAMVKVVFFPSLEKGFPNPVPVWEQFILIATEFCLRWRWFTIPIPIVLFTVAGVSGDLRLRRQSAALPHHKDGTLVPVKRPVGIVIIALINVLGGILYILFTAFLPRVRNGSQGVLTLALLAGVGLGVALLMLQNWGRWIAIVLYGLSLLRAAASLVLAHSLANVLLELVLASYPAWVVWYLFRQRVRAAFLKIPLD